MIGNFRIVIILIKKKKRIHYIVMKSKENVEILTRIGNSDYESIELSRNSTNIKQARKKPNFRIRKGLLLK